MWSRMEARVFRRLARVRRRTVRQDHAPSLGSRGWDAEAAAAAPHCCLAAGVRTGRSVHTAAPAASPPSRGRPRLWSPDVFAPLERIDITVEEALKELRDYRGNDPVVWRAAMDSLIDIHRSPSKHLVRPQLVLLGGAWDVPADKSGVHAGEAPGDKGTVRGGDGSGSDGSSSDSDGVGKHHLTVSAGGGAEAEAALEQFSAGLELQHLFMMVHDDVIDRATRRRGKPPVHMAARMHGRDAGVRVGASYHLATIVGDVIYAKAMQLMANASVTASAPEALSTVLSDGMATGFGQFCDIVGWGEVEARLRASLPTEVRSGMVAEEVLLDKSGRTTMATPLVCGMSLVGADPAAIQAARTWGEHAGVAMQAVDDIADLVVEHAATGKDSFQDFRDQRLTLLLFLLWDRAKYTADWADLTRLWRGISSARGSGDYSALLPHQRRELMAMLERHGVVESAFEFARAQMDAAEEVVKSLPQDQTLAAGLQRFLVGMRDHTRKLEMALEQEADMYGG